MWITPIFLNYYILVVKLIRFNELLTGSIQRFLPRKVRIVMGLGRTTETVVNCPKKQMQKTRLIQSRKRIAMVAHDNKKKDLTDWAVFNRQELARHELLATGTTGKLLEDQLDRPVKKLMSGPLGGDQQVGTLIALGEIDILIFFWDPMQSQPHDSDVKALLRVAIAWNCIVACDRATADFILTSPLMMQSYEIRVPDYEEYLSRKI